MPGDHPTMRPFQTTLMGAAQGVLDYYGSPITAPFLFGASGHAFLINIHPELCPSGPYCWNHARFDALLRNTGVERVPLGSFSAESSPADRAAVQAAIRA